MALTAASLSRHKQRLPVPVATRCRVSVACLGQTWRMGRQCFQADLMRGWKVAGGVLGPSMWSPSPSLRPTPVPQGL